MLATLDRLLLGAGIGENQIVVRPIVGQATLLDRPILDVALDHRIDRRSSDARNGERILRAERASYYQ
jgi:hypothetical protein